MELDILHKSENLPTSLFFREHNIYNSLQWFFKINKLGIVGELTHRTFSHKTTKEIQPYKSCYGCLLRFMVLKCLMYIKSNLSTSRGRHFCNLKFKDPSQHSHVLESGWSFDIQTTPYSSINHLFKGPNVIFSLFQTTVFLRSWPSYQGFHHFRPDTFQLHVCNWILPLLWGSCFLLLQWLHVHKLTPRPQMRSKSLFQTESPVRPFSSTVPDYFSPLARKPQDQLPEKSINIVQPQWLERKWVM